MPPSPTDRIEKSILLRASVSQVWQALTQAEEFGTWFRAAMTGPFVLGQRARGAITYAGYGHLTLDVLVIALEPERYFAFRWPHGEVEVGVDFSTVPTTLVEFRLAATEDGTRLTVVESGFDQLPAALRSKAFEDNQGGWETQMENIRVHVDG